MFSINSFVKPFAGMLLGGTVGLLISKYAGTLGIGGSIGGVLYYSDIVTAALFIIGAIAFKGKTALSEVMATAAVFQFACTIIKIIWSSISGA